MNEEMINKEYEDLIQETLMHYAGFSQDKDSEGKYEYDEKLLNEVAESAMEEEINKVIIIGRYALKHDEEFVFSNAYKEFIEDLKDAGNTIGVFNSESHLTFDDIVLYLKCYKEELFEMRTAAETEKEKDKLMSQLVIADDILNDLTMRNGKYAFSKIKEYKEKIND